MLISTKRPIKQLIKIISNKTFEHKMSSTKSMMCTKLAGDLDLGRF